MGQNSTGAKSATQRFRIEIVRKDAHEQLKVGAKKDAVARFYKQHEITFVVGKFDDSEFEVIGTLTQLGDAHRSVVELTMH